MLLACQAPLPHAEPVAVVAGPFVVVVARASLSVASPRGVAPGRPEGMPGRSRPPRCPGPPGAPGPAPGAEGSTPHAGRAARACPGPAPARGPGGAPRRASPSGGGAAPAPAGSQRPPLYLPLS